MPGKPGHFQSITPLILRLQHPQKSLPALLKFESLQPPGANDPVWKEHHNQYKYDSKDQWPAGAKPSIQKLAENLHDPSP